MKSEELDKKTCKKERNAVSWDDDAGPGALRYLFSIKMFAHFADERKWEMEREILNEGLFMCLSVDSCEGRGGGGLSAGAAHISLPYVPT